MSTAWYEFSAEPAVFVYSFAITTYTIVVPNLILQKSCSPQVEPPIDFVCNNTRILTEAEDLVRIRSTLCEVLPLLALFLAGWYRDATGLNKPMMYSSLIGDLVGVSTELFAAWKWAVPVRISCILSTLFHGAVGGRKLFYLGAACVVTDLSQPEERTVRLTLNLAASLAGACVSTGFSHYYLKHLGYKLSLVVVIVLLLLSLVLVFYIFQDNSKLMKNENWSFNDKMKTVFRKRPNNMVIWLMIISSGLFNTTIKAEESLMPTYLHERFGFSFKQVGFYKTYLLMIGVASSIALPRLLSILLKTWDFNIGILSAVMAVASSVAMTFARRRAELLTIALLNFTKCFLCSVPLSIVTRSVNEFEIGIYLALCYLAECILDAMSYHIYAILYEATWETTPGLFYLASAAVAFFLIIFYRIASNIYNPSEAESAEINTSNNIESCEIASRQKRERF